MKRVIGLILFSLLLSFAFIMTSSVNAEEAALLKGTISDVEGSPVQGAMLYVYNSLDVKRTADFISSPTNKDGRFSMEVPAGKYWLVARKKSEDYGLLMPGDKHSGDPEEVELISSGEEELIFVVADLREAIKMKKEAMDRPFKITGRRIDKNGDPLTNAYAIANKKSELTRIPDFLSSWTDEQGRFTLYLSEGNYYLGGAEEFPPGRKFFISHKISADKDKSGIKNKKRG